ncbi:heparinase II/III family protein [Fredinandcohnia sp. 179-A 10B2 NHS]|uniref:heparinase II/III family protein n=1 Tax=Fredinandcohnia sp. 179-A 10B2 NHS TaxID=3235176 RepID=UPI0039A3C5E2
MKKKLVLYYNTIKYLKPKQVYYRLFNRFKRELYKRNLVTIKLKLNDTKKNKKQGTFIIPELDFNESYLERFNIEDVLNDKYTFINITHQVELKNAWNNKDLQHLWRYNLHYFEYLYKLAYEYSKKENATIFYEKYKSLINNWIDNNRFAYGDGWHPYTISLRITNWISTYQMFEERLEQDVEFNKRFKVSIYEQYKYLQSNLEKDVLGNHYFENIKALIIGSVFFEDIRVKEKFKKELLYQLDEQILDDGMHFELSPMYHKIILEDLIKITYWLKDDIIYRSLISYIQKMLDVLYSLEDSFGKTPAFNDSADGISRDLNCLLEVCKTVFNLEPQFKKTLGNSGYYIVKDHYKKLIFDTGDICPSYLPAHGHCDALSFELSINTKPFIVNSGTFRYENGKWRDYFRSTKAHNTVTISEQEQSQLWGNFRVAKRIKSVRRKHFIYNNIPFYSGAYTSYQGAEHKRYIGNIDSDKLIVLDYVTTKSKGKVKSYLHFVPGTKLEKVNNSIHILNTKRERMEINFIGTREVDFEHGWYSQEFNVKEENCTVICNKDESKDVFGYLIQINPYNIQQYKIYQSETEIKLISDTDEIKINIKELGGVL